VRRSGSRRKVVADQLHAIDMADHIATVRRADHAGGQGVVQSQPHRELATGLQVSEPVLAVRAGQFRIVDDLQRASVGQHEMQGVARSCCVQLRQSKADRPHAAFGLVMRERLHDGRSRACSVGRHGLCCADRDRECGRDDRAGEGGAYRRDDKGGTGVHRATLRAGFRVIPVGVRASLAMAAGPSFWRSRCHPARGRLRPVTLRPRLSHGFAVFQLRLSYRHDLPGSSASEGGELCRTACSRGLPLSYAGHPGYRGCRVVESLSR
jgi:hypothetical protein